MTTTHQVGLEQLEALTSVLARWLPPEPPLTLFRDLAPFLRPRGIDEPPRWSGLTDDCSPFEFSLAFDAEGPSLRLLVEAQDDPASPETYWRAGRGLMDWLAERFTLDLRRFQLVEDLYVPTDAEAYWSTWHSVDVVAGVAPRIRVYLNPAAQGLSNVALVLGETFDRLGVSESAALLTGLEGLAWRPVVVTLDVSRAIDRVGLHIMLPGASAEDLERLAALAPGSERGEVSQFLEVMTLQDRADRRPMFATLHLDPSGVGAVGFAVPCVPYAPNDEVAAQRISRLLALHDLPDEPYVSCLRALTSDPAESSGVNSFVSFVRAGDQARVSIAIGSRLYFPRYGWLAFDPPRWWPSPRDVSPLTGTVQRSAS